MARAVGPTAKFLWHVCVAHSRDPFCAALQPLYLLRNIFVKHGRRVRWEEREGGETGERRKTEHKGEKLRVEASC